MKILDKLEEAGSETADRRDFLKKAGKLAATVPAVALLLSAHATPAAASGRYGRGHGRRRHGNHGLRRRGHGHSRRAFGHSHKRH